MGQTNLLAPAAGINREEEFDTPIGRKGYLIAALNSAFPRGLCPHKS